MALKSSLKVRVEAAMGRTSRRRLDGFIVRVGLDVETLTNCVMGSVNICIMYITLSVRLHTLPEVRQIKLSDSDWINDLIS